MVDRMTGHVAMLNLPEFDNYYSGASWYRDYVAYCGVSDDGQKLYAIVAQVSRRKPVMKKPLAGASVGEDAAPDSACPLPRWQRAPVRVTFEPADGSKQSFVIRGHVVDAVDDAEDDVASK